MKKNLPLIVAIVAATAGLIMNTSCKKQEESTQMSQSAAQMEQSISLTELKTLKFLDNYAEMKQGAKIDGEAVSPEEARRQLETAFNYHYSFTQTSIVNNRFDTVRVAMPTTNLDGRIAYNDLLNTYGNIVDAVRNVYSSINIENKTLQFVMMNLNNTKAEGDSINIVINTGSRDIDPGIPEPHPDPWYGIPFVEPECYIWGYTDYIGSFLPANNAASQLDIKISNYDDIHAIAQESPHVFLEDPYIFAIYQGSTETDWLFYEYGVTEEMADNYLLCWDDLNDLYRQMMEHTHYRNMEIRPYGHDGYYKSYVLAKKYCLNPGDINELYYISHTQYVYHATIRMQINQDYPISIDE